MLQGYFSIDGSHLWLPYRGKNNNIQVELERYMKHTMTPLNGHNQLMGFAELLFGNYFLETRLGCYLTEPSLVPPDTQLDLLPCPTCDNETYTVSSSSSTSAVSRPCTYDMWTMYFDGSKTQEGFGFGCVLIDPLQRKHLISSHLELKCMNNIVEYEELLLGLQKAIDLNIANLQVVGDSKIMVRHVRNIIHCVSPHLKSYQQELWKLISHFQAFNIISVPRMCSIVVDAFENAATRMSPLRDNFFIEILYKPYVPDNITNLRFFL